MYCKLAIITLQEKFLQMNYEQISALLGKQLEIRAISVNELNTTPPRADETILYFIPGIRAMVEQMYPECTTYIQASREILLCNLKELFSLGTNRKRILVVNDNKGNTEEMLQDLSVMDLPHEFVGYYPGQQITGEIEGIVTSGERALIPLELQDLPVIDCGMRFISLETIFFLFNHFSIPYTPAPLARKYLQIVVMLSEKWPMLGAGRFISPWFGTTGEQNAKVTFADFTTNSQAMKKFILHTTKMATTGKPIHIYGEIGTGKKMISEAIHNASSCKDDPFISINCAARSQDILEKELFGWESGDSISPGLMEAAQSGTLCIEEVGMLDESLQTRLLQALTEGRIIRTGGNDYVKIHARVITTSSSRLDKESTRPFNKDLLLLLSRYTCRVPTLNEREEDFEDLIHTYLKQHLHTADIHITDEAISDLKRYNWQGNVQELYNVLQYMSCTGEGKLTREELPYFITTRGDIEDVALAASSSENTGNTDKLCKAIENHGFLAESLEILDIYLHGKKSNIAYGRTTLQKLLAGRGIVLSPQQLRLRLEKLDELGLLLVRPGRGGTTISQSGEHFLMSVHKK